jgi:hypothetical protein
MTCCGAHWLVPMGGTIGVTIGAIDGGTIPHTVGGQMGGRSIELLHIGCISPLTHRHTQFADAPVVSAIEQPAATIRTRRSMMVPLSSAPPRGSYQSGLRRV